MPGIEECPHRDRERHGDLPRRVLDLRERFGSGEEPFAQLHLVRAIECHASHVQIEHEHRINVVPEPHGAYVAEAAHEQASANEQEHGQRTLRDLQRESQRRAMIPSIASAGPQIGGEIDRAKLPCRSHSGEQAGRERCRGGERERSRIARDARSGPRREKGGPKERAAGLRDDEPGHAAERCEQHTLGDEL
jgi:hypothetical protein